MNAADRELLTGMGNCFEACRATFEETLAMVAGSRSRSEEEVVATLRRLADADGSDPEYRRLRARFPSTFPV